MIKTKQGIKNYSVGETFKEFMLVKGIEERFTRAKKPFLTVNLGDNTGEIPMMVWDGVETFLERYEREDIVLVDGTISEYQGNRQFNLNSLRLKNELDDIELSDLLESAPISSSDLMKEIDDTIAELENETIKVITEKVVDQHREKLKTYPAARGIHHAYVSGLAYHTVEMIRIGKALCELYPTLNRDLLLAGAIMHDLAKTEEYSGVVAPETTLKGRMIGHISMISEDVGHVARELGVNDNEEVIILKNILMSHHGKLEWGSPVLGLTAEAIMLHKIDMISARMDTITSELDKTKEGEFTERIFALDNRSLYKHTL